MHVPKMIWTYLSLFSTRHSNGKKEFTLPLSSKASWSVLVFAFAFLSQNPSSNIFVKEMADVSCSLMGTRLAGSQTKAPIVHLVGNTEKWSQEKKRARVTTGTITIALLCRPSLHDWDSSVLYQLPRNDIKYNRHLSPSHNNYANYIYPLNNPHRHFLFVLTRSKCTTMDVV